MGNRVIKVGSLFAGIGGFDCGFERAGFETIWQVEIDPFCNKILARHFPKAKRYGDITKVTGLEKVDVITGGFPCQDLSVAGKRAGLKGERSGLFFELKRIVSEVRPTWIVVENVPGLLSSNGGKDFGLVLFHLEECGYGLSWRILDSRYFGVAQRRRRVFIVGYLGKPCPPEILFEPEGVSGNLEKKRKTRSDIAGSLTGGSGKRGHRISTEGARDGQLISHPLTARGHKGGDPTTDQYITLQDYKQNGGAMSGIVPTPNASGAGVERVGGQGAEAGFYVPIFGFSAGNSAKARGIGLAENETPPIKSEPSGTNQIPTIAYVSPPADPNGMRKITGISRRLDTPDGSRYRALGNAVTVSVAFWIAKRIMNFASAGIEVRE